MSSTILCDVCVCVWGVCVCVCVGVGVCVCVGVRVCELQLNTKRAANLTKTRLTQQSSNSLK